MSRKGIPEEKKERYLKASLKAIKNDKNVVMFNDVIAVIGITKTTFYNYFPPESEMYIQIKEALDENRVNMKAAIRTKLLESGNAAALIALYKIIGDVNERNALRQTYEEDKKTDEKIDLKL